MLTALAASGLFLKRCGQDRIPATQHVCPCVWGLMRDRSGGLGLHQLDAVPARVLRLTAARG